jgi:Zn-dependent peptidase ImmA (M78 family)
MVMFPKSVNVLGTKYKVLHKKINPNLLGLCDKDKKLIYINTGQSKKEAIYTYYHELIHAIFRENNLDAIISDEMEELVCLATEKVLDAIAPVVINNKKEFSE